MLQRDKELLALLHTPTRMRPHFSWWGVLLQVRVDADGQLVAHTRYMAASRERHNAEVYAGRLLDICLASGYRVTAQLGHLYYEMADAKYHKTAILAVDYNPGAVNSAPAYALLHQD